jgi:hypothetical protein
MTERASRSWPVTTRRIFLRRGLRALLLVRAILRAFLHKMAEWANLDVAATEYRVFTAMAQIGAGIFSWAGHGSACLADLEGNPGALARL